MLQRLDNASLRLPHARGGVSTSRAHTHDTPQPSPRPWGCFFYKGGWLRSDKAFPTPVGVFPTRHASLTLPDSLPHARGGVSGAGFDELRGRLPSPRPWGCFRGGCLCGLYGSAFPTPVGVFPPLPLSSVTLLGLPHARGGVSHAHHHCTSHTQPSPRPWGCFRWIYAAFLEDLAFPTPVGVFPFPVLSLVPVVGLPHARGGVSHRQLARIHVLPPSPRPWGCFRSRAPGPC